MFVILTKNWAPMNCLVELRFNLKILLESTALTSETNPIILDKLAS